MEVSNLGGIVSNSQHQIETCVYEDILLGFDNVEDNHSNGYMSAIIGRVCGRLREGKFKLDGKEYCASVNKERNGIKFALHGGETGFDQKIWDAREFESPEGPAVELTLLSPDGDQGFPGNLFVRVVYTLTQCNSWKLQYWAVTDKPTVVNLTNHAYFNLNGGKSDAMGHVVQLNCSRFTPTDEGLLPTGQVLPVANTALDFTSPRRVGQDVDTTEEFVAGAGGYDHNFLIDRDGPGLALAASVEDPASGRKMDVVTTEPCLQFYSGNFLKPGLKGKYGITYGQRHGLCFETQHTPDSPNHAGFKSIRLDPGKVMQSTTIYKFRT